MTRLVVALVLATVLLSGCSTLAPAPSASSTDQVFEDAYAEQRSDLQVTGTGTVIRILEDDTEGDRHQRFIVELGSGQTLLIAHNIDVAPRVRSLAEGDIVEFNGVYEYNDEGGVVHWTHHDPQGQHEPGWIRHGGQLYQ